MVLPLENGTTEVQVVSWYDNENSYIRQMVRTIKHFGKLTERLIFSKCRRIDSNEGSGLKWAGLTVPGPLHGNHGMLLFTKYAVTAKNIIKEAPQMLNKKSVDDINVKGKSSCKM